MKNSVPGLIVLAAPAVGSAPLSSGMPPPPPQTSLFEEGEAVIANHKGYYYLAKVEKVEYDKDWKYLIHYIGWNKRQEKDNDPMEKLVNISIPLTLKKQLIIDFEFINQMDKLVRLPRTPNVDAIIEKYRDYRGKKEGLIAESVGEVLNGLRVYFNKALPVLLLYNKERQQYQEAIIENSSCPFPSTIYGAEHLLRLFVKLPALLYELNIEKETLVELQQNLLDFLKFLQKNQSAFFLSSYQLPED